MPISIQIAILQAFGSKMAYLDHLLCSYMKISGQSEMEEQFKATCFFPLTLLSFSEFPTSSKTVYPAFLHSTFLM